MLAQPSRPPPLVDAGGRPLRLGAEIGRGGEGSVYALADRTDVVAKLYHRPPDAEKAAKIVAMASLGNERLLKLAAWPLSAIHAAAAGKPVLGFLMPRITGHKPAFALYSPKLRLQEFPTAGWAFLIHAAANAARAFAVVHESGHVIGDVNHGNLVVAADATVKLIDCDSFQVNGKGRRWLCEVGVPTHQPPELQGLTSYRGVTRTPNQDNFGLAVILFQLLFMARHPFSGRYLGSGDMPIERAIGEYRFAYGRGALGAEMKSPPGSLALSGVTPALAQLFERAFAREGSRDGARPKPEAWIAALQDLARGLRKCPANAAHEYYGALAKCPWCEIEARGGFVLFPVVLVPGAGARPGGLDVAALWQEMRTIPDPGALPPLPAPAALVQKPARASPRVRRRRRRALLRRVLAVGFALVALGALAGAGLGAIPLSAAAVAAGVLLLCAALLFFVRRDERTGLRLAAEKARAQWAGLARRWTNETGDDTFTERRMALEKLRADYERLPHERLRRLQDLETNREGAQLTAFLDRCPLDGAQLKGFGNAKITTLQSYGIETAADIVDHRVLAVPGFGPVLLKRLKAWRRQQEARFVFDPKKGVSSTDKATVEQRFLAEKLRLERALAEGVAQLAALGKERLARRKALEQEARAAAATLLAAETDLA